MNAFVSKLIAIGVPLFFIGSVAAEIRVSESFDYPAGSYDSVPSDSLEPPYKSPPGGFKDLNGGTGWKRNWDAHVKTCALVIEDGPIGAWMSGPADKHVYWRSRNMHPIGSTDDGALVSWNSLRFCMSAGGKGGIRVTDPNGGTKYNLRIGKEGVYELGGGHGTPEVDTSALKVSSDASQPDFVLLKLENTNHSREQKAGAWINPDLTRGEEGLGAPDLSVTYTVFASRKIGGININPHGLRIDEIIFGDRLQDVTADIPPVAAYQPIPADEGDDVSVSKTLRWENADADRYEVFLWKASEKKPTAPTAVVTERSYDPPAHLDYNSAYAWQVDVIKGALTVTGATWRFTTGDAIPPGPPSQLTPADGAANLPVTASLTWAEAARATQYDIYLWKSAAARPPPPPATVYTESYTPALPLAFDTPYSWQVIAVNEFGSNTQAPIGNFSTECRVNSPAPADLSGDMPPWMRLRWFDAPGVDSYDVYLWPTGKTRPVSPTAQVREPSYTPERTLAFDAAYQWQVVAKLSAGGIVKGPTWKFNTLTEEASDHAPPFDISPSAQAQRKLRYETEGLAKLTASDTPLKAGLKLAFYGDSITWQNNYIKQIEQALAASTNTAALGTTLINHGVNGGGVLTIRDGDEGKSHFGNTAPPPFATTIAAEQPDLVVLFIGINDIWWRKTSEADFRQALIDLISQARAGGVRYFVMATPWLRGEHPDGSNVSDEQIKRYAGICEEVAQETKISFVNLHEQARLYLMNHNVTLEADGRVRYRKNGILTYDGVHPSTAGNAFLANQLAIGIRHALSSDSDN